MGAAAVTVMPATSGFCLHRPDGRLAAGFTLLELLVVMTLLSLMAAWVGPAAWRALDSARDRTQVAHIAATLSALPVTAFQLGRPLRLDAPAFAAMLPELPQGWSLHVDDPLEYASNGVARGGVLRLRRIGRHDRVWDVQALTGEVALRAEVASP